jgi:hypothetical protein
MGEPSNTKEQQKAENNLPTSYLSATYMSVDNEQTVNPFFQQTNIYCSKDLGAALRAYYNTLPDDAMYQTIQLNRPASMQPDKKK